MRNPLVQLIEWFTRPKPTPPPPVSPQQAEAARFLAKELGRESERRLAQQAAATAARRGGFALAASAPAVIAGILVVAAVGVGVTMAREWGKPSVEPVRAGTAMSKSRPSLPVPLHQSQPAAGGGAYFLYAVETSGWSFYIGRSADVEGRAAGSFPDGGHGKQPVAFKKLTSEPFATSGHAKAYLKSQVSPGKQSVWTGQWYKFKGEEYRSVHVGTL